MLTGHVILFCVVILVLIAFIAPLFVRTGFELNLTWRLTLCVGVAGIIAVAYREPALEAGVSATAVLALLLVIRLSVYKFMIMRFQKRAYDLMRTRMFSEAVKKDPQTAARMVGGSFHGDT